ncbi:MAG: carbamoyl phosphate synthase large subunit, partial [Parachlamydiaceae bacterium]
GVGASFAKAYARALLGAGEVLPVAGGTVFISVKDSDKEKIIEVAKNITALGFKIVATRGTQKILNAAGITANAVNKVAEGRPNIVDLIKNDEVDLVINTTAGKKAVSDSYLIRRETIMNKVMYATTISGAKAISQALGAENLNKVNKLQDLHME